MSSTTIQNYLCHILCPDANMEVVGFLPEMVHFGISNNWDTRLPASLMGAIESSVNNKALVNGLNLASALTNFDLIKKSFTQQIWRGSSPIEFNMVLLFDAVNDPITEVMQAQRDLLALSAPYTSQTANQAVDLANQAKNSLGQLPVVGNLIQKLPQAQTNEYLLPPGPSLFDPTKNEISVTLGNYLFLPSVVITNVSNVVESRFDADGNPISGQIDVTLRTITIPSREDIMDFFISVPSNASGTSGYTGKGTYNF